MKIREMKKDVQNTLKGKWLKVALPFVVLQMVWWGILYLPQLILYLELPYAARLIFVLVICFLMIGFTIWTAFGKVVLIKKLFDGEDITVKTVFKESFINRKIANGLAGKYLFRVGFWILAATFVLPSIIVVNAQNQVGINLLSLILSIIFTVFSIFKLLQYAFTYFLASDYKDKSLNEIFNKSKELMKENKAKYVVLFFSFTGCFLISLMPFFVISGVFASMWPSELIEGVYVSQMPDWLVMFELLLFAPLAVVEPYYLCTVSCFYKSLEPEKCFDEKYTKPESSKAKYYGLIAVIFAIIFGAIGLIFAY